jgi:hypothetical protein
MTSSRQPIAFHSHIVRPTSSVAAKEDAGMYSPEADKPYNFMQRAGLRFLGLVLARQII